MEISDAFVDQQCYMYPCYFAKRFDDADPVVIIYAACYCPVADDDAVADDADDMRIQPSVPLSFDLKH